MKLFSIYLAFIEYFTQNGLFLSNNLEGPMQGKIIPDLITAMQNGTTYVNVHTEQNPEGETGGQLVDIP